MLSLVSHVLFPTAAMLQAILLYFAESDVRHAITRQKKNFIKDQIGLFYTILNSDILQLRLSCPMTHFRIVHSHFLHSASDVCGGEREITSTPWLDEHAF